MKDLQDILEDAGLLQDEDYLYKEHYRYISTEEPEIWSLCLSESMEAAREVWRDLALDPEDLPLLAALETSEVAWEPYLRGKGITPPLLWSVTARELLHLCARTMLEAT
jgi:hypothetical protein